MEISCHGGLLPAKLVLDTILENVPATISVKDAKTFRYALMNRAAEEFFGKPREEMVGKTAEELARLLAKGGFAARLR